jgi:ABC-2 type transport system permease protein
LVFIVKGILLVPIEGSLLLFLFGTGLHLFAATSLGIFMATVTRTMPQFAMLAILVLLPLQLLSGNSTPRESMPQFVQTVMSVTPTTHFVAIGQAVLFRGAGFTVVWPQLLALAVIGIVLFAVSLNRFRKTIGDMA